MISNRPLFPGKHCKYFDWILVMHFRSEFFLEQFVSEISNTIIWFYFIICDYILDNENCRPKTNYFYYFSYLLAKHLSPAHLVLVILFYFNCFYLRNLIADLFPCVICRNTIATLDSKKPIYELVKKSRNLPEIFKLYYLANFLNFHHRYTLNFQGNWM